MYFVLEFIIKTQILSLFLVISVNTYLSGTFCAVAYVVCKWLYWFRC